MMDAKICYGIALSLAFLSLSFLAQAAMHPGQGALFFSQALIGLIALAAGAMFAAAGRAQRG